MPDIAEAPCLAVRDLTVRFGEFTAVQNISFDLTHGQVTAMCGLNGCGKSSALKAIRRLLPSTGTITLSGTDLHTLSEKQIAKHIGMLGQNPQAPDQMSVRELVSLGRFAHRSALGGLQPYDHKTISKALGATAVSELADNTLGTISGGQRQR
ncbi:MAG: ABC transporter ATP-binding protein, partial [Pseudomonadota bacterium]